jgi:hypothetical protein
MTTTITHPHVGDYVAETLVTDTRVYKIIKVTAKTITVMPGRQGETVKVENRDGNPFPCVWTAITFNDADAPYAYTLRLRKDGTYRMGNTARPLRPAQLIDGQPVSYTDYRM